METAKKIVIIGGTGLIGSELADFFARKGYNILILSRSTAKEIGGISYKKWDGENLDSLSSFLNNSLAVINLAGKSINTRFTPSNKKDIISSRVIPTESIGKAIAKCTIPPKVWINASAIGFYGISNTPKDEKSLPGEDFVAEVCKKWEEAAHTTVLTHTRKVIIRIGIVLSDKGGALKELIKFTKLGMGGKSGPGSHIMSWIHIQDLVGIIELAINDTRLEGPVNSVSPQPVSNKEFMKVLRKTIGIKIGIPQPRVLLKIAGHILGIEPELVLASQNVVPEKIKQSGFNYQFPSIEEALIDLIKTR